VRRFGAFSQRDIVRQEAGSLPLSGNRPQASLNAGSLRRSFRSSASGKPQVMANSRACRMSAIVWVIKAGVPMVGNDRDQCVDQAKSPVGTCQKQNITVGTDQPAVECHGDLFPANTW